MANQFIDIEAVDAGLRSITSLRYAFSELFETLQRGSGVSAGSPSSSSTSDSNATDKNNQQDNLKVVKTQEILSTIMANIKKMETSVELLNQTNQNQINLGMLGTLCADPAFEKTGLYSNILGLYRWFDRVHEYSNVAHHRFNMLNIVNRNSQASEHLFKNKSFIRMTNRWSSFNTLNMSSAQIDHFLNNLSRAIPNLRIEIKRPYGNPTILIMTLDGTLKALALLNGLVIEWITAKAITEDFLDEYGNIDIWAESRYEVFRKVSFNAISATQHFSSLIHFDAAIRSWMNWFASYQSLFTKPCYKCGCRLNSSYELPTSREYRSMEAFHESCRF